MIPVLAAIDTRPEDWDAAAEALAPLLGPGTLVVQSTDFSHYLGPGPVAIHDGESLAAIATGDPAEIAGLVQPDHLDSRAAMAIQMRLSARQGAQPTVIANRSSAGLGTPAAETTSYAVIVWHPDPAATAALRYDDQAVVYLGGDVLLGRHFTRPLASPAARRAVVEAIRGITRGAPLIANLEGVLLDGPVAHAPPGAHLMETAPAGPILTDLGVTALSLANNHSFDFGAEGYRATRAALADPGIAALDHGEVADLGPLRLLALKLLPGGREGPDAALALDPASVCTLDAPGPLVVMPHWGREYSAEPDAAERALARALAGCAVNMVAGVHSHRASDRIERAGPATMMVYSLGNLMFDQTGPKASSALLELRLFRQGTLAARLVPLPNLFERARDVAGAQPSGQSFGRK